VYIKLKAKRLVLVALLVEQLAHDPKFKGLNPAAIDSDENSAMQKKLRFKIYFLLNSVATKSKFKNDGQHE
jgi:hypothetical protein